MTNSIQISHPFHLRVMGNNQSQEIQLLEILPSITEGKVFKTSVTFLRNENTPRTSFHCTPPIKRHFFSNVKIYCRFIVGCPSLLEHFFKHLDADVFKMNEDSVPVRKGLTSQASVPKMKGSTKWVILISLKDF